jgi:type IV secretion system protein VirD4
LSKRLGYDTVKASSNSGPALWRMFRRDKLSITQSDRERALLLPQEIVRLDPRHAILIRPGMYPILSKRIRHFEEKTFTRLLRKAPDVSPIKIEVRMDTGAGFHPAAPAKAAAPATAAKAATAATASDAASTAAVPSKAKRTKKPASASSSTKEESTASQAVNRRLVEAPSSDAEPHFVRPNLLPHQSDGLLNSIFGAEVDLSNAGLADGKAKVSALLDKVQTVESMNFPRKKA